MKAVSYSYETVEHTDSDENEDGIALRIRLRNFMLKFPFLGRLELGFRTSESWTILTLLLHSSPNLQHLILRKVCLLYMNEQFQTAWFSALSSSYHSILFFFNDRN